VKAGIKGRNQDETSMSQWMTALQAWAPAHLSAHPVLRNVWNHGSLILHGSTTLGIDDAFSDLDLWLLVPDSLLPAIDALSNTRFFPFTLNGKEGHINVESDEEFHQRISACDFPLIAELRRAEILLDRQGSVRSLQETALRPMTENVRVAWFRYHYILMRQAHRALDNPIERGDAPTVLFGVSTTIEHALQAALVLEEEPYPYIKWLHHAASRSPTGAVLVPLVRDLLELLAAGMLFYPGPEKDHPLSLKLREIRNGLIAAAREKGIDGMWLEKWWLSIDTVREEITRVRWGGICAD
jgi:hypothetical protein